MRVTVPAPPVRDELAPLRGAVLVCTVVLTGSYLSVLYRVVDTVGGVTTLALLVAGALALSVVVSSLVTPRQGVGIAATLLVLGLATYLLFVPPAYFAVLTPGRFVGDTVALVTGFSVLGMTRAGVWALSVAPAPVFLTWYFALRREDARAATVGGLALGFFVLTGDAGTTATLLGVLAAAGLLGFGTLARHGGSHRQLDAIAVAFALMILASATVSAVPGTNRSPVLPAQTTSIQTELISADEQVSIGGSIRLSPEVRFTVHADQPDYWRVGVYDRYTGTDWVRTGGAHEFRGSLSAPPAPTRRNVQTVTAEVPLNVIPAAAKATRVSGVRAKATELGGVQPVGTIHAGKDFSVESQTPVVTAARLRTAGTDYPAAIRTRYLQLPESTPARVGEFTSNLTSDAATPYQKAVTIRDWLETNKQYSLSVRKPRGNIADAFIFQMERGYCVYFATTMVAMLRTQGIPARFVVGYTPGQRVSQDEWVVRGLDSHAWVEVYFPDVGWVRFDPTPAAPRQSAENQRVTAARTAGMDNVDVDGSQNGTWTPTTTAPEGVGVNNSSGGAAFGQAGGTGFGRNAFFRTTAPGNVSGADPAGGTGAGGDQPVHLPPPSVVGLWSVLLVGLAAVLRRTGLAERGYRTVWLRVEPRGSSAEQVAGAFARVEYLLARAHRERRADETVREYLQAVRADERARRVAAIRERARYAGEVTPEMAAEARSLVADLLGDGRA